tara:strand:+ start:684 stop:800 length:117 start_codon:yes stop_codon:yes gene_type:complete
MKKQEWYRFYAWQLKEDTDFLMKKMVDRKFKRIIENDN